MYVKFTQTESVSDTRAHPGGRSITRDVYPQEFFGFWVILLKIYNFLVFGNYGNFKYGKKASNDDEKGCKPDIGEF